MQARGVNSRELTGESLCKGAEHLEIAHGRKQLTPRNRPTQMTVWEGLSVRKGGTSREAQAFYEQRNRSRAGVTAGTHLEVRLNRVCSAKSDSVSRSSSFFLIEAAPKAKRTLRKLSPSNFQLAGPIALDLLGHRSLCQGEDSQLTTSGAQAAGPVSLPGRWPSGMGPPGTEMDFDRTRYGHAECPRKLRNQPLVELVASARCLSIWTSSCDWSHWQAGRLEPHEQVATLS